MNKSSKLVHGIGVKGTTYPTWDGKKILKEYAAWSGMLRRCTEEYWKKKPSYRGVTCSDNFKNYSYFYEWCQKQVLLNGSNDGWHLDKDLLFKGNKLYSEDTCVFIPPRVNTLLIKRELDRGKHPIGVWFYKKYGKFVSQCNNGKGLQIYLGYHATARQAFQAYKTFKEALIKEVANEYKNQLDSRVYEALMNYEVNEDD